MDELEREIDRLEAEIDATPYGDKRDTLEALHGELLDRWNELT